MPVPTPSPVIRVRLIHGQGLDLTEGSRFFIAYTDASAPSIADLNTLASFVRSTWTAQLAGLMSASSGLQLTICDDLASASGNEGQDTTVVSGTRAGGVIEQNTAVQVNFKVARRYRGGKYKCYLPFGTITDVSVGQVWTLAFTNAVTAGWNAFIAAINGHVAGGITAGAQVGVSYYHGPQSNNKGGTWSRKNIPSPRGTPVVDPIISVATSRTITNLRRRQGRP